MCRREDCILDIDAAGEGNASAKVLEIFNARASMRQSLERVREDLTRQIEAIARLVKGS